MKLRHAGDIGDTDGADLDGIGMSRPEQRRLWREYAKHFPFDGAHHPQQKKVMWKRISRRIFGREEKMRERERRGREAEDTQSQTDRTAQGQNDQTAMGHQQHIIPAECVTLCKEIGSGEFGHVFQGQRLSINRLND